MDVTIKKAEHQRIDAFELWCWRRLLRVPWTARGSKELQSLGLDVRVLDENREEVELMETSEYGNTDLNAIIAGSDRNFAFEDDSSFAQAGFSTKKFDTEGELVDDEDEQFEDEEDDFSDIPTDFDEE